MELEHSGIFVIDGPEYLSNLTTTAIGNRGGWWLVSYIIFTTVPVEPLQRPVDG